MGWEHATAATLAADDPLVLRLRREAQPLRLREVLRNHADLPAAAATPAIVLPLAVDGRVRAIAMYGGHPSGTDLSPDEIACLARLAAAGAMARERLLNERLAEQVAVLQRQLGNTTVPTISGVVAPTQATTA